MTVHQNSLIFNLIRIKMQTVPSIDVAYGRVRQFRRRDVYVSKLPVEGEKVEVS